MELMENGRRDLHTFAFAEEFARDILQLRGEKAKKAAYRISEAEIIVASLESLPTSSYEEYRETSFRTQHRREWLRYKILDELYHLERLDNDDEICLGHGGTRPEEVRYESQAYIVIGPPASGKSGLAIKLADEYGAYLLDSDYAKRKFPEYHGYIGGASLVHREADDLVFGPEDSLAEYCLYSSANIVVPLVGRTMDSVEEFCNMLVDYGYTINVIDVELDHFMCTLRAYSRFLQTKRYVPLSYVFDIVADNPMEVYKELKRKYKSNPNYKSFTQVSTNVEYGQAPKVIDSCRESPMLFQ